MIRLRSLEDVRTAGDLRWFGPALDLLGDTPPDPDAPVRDFFSRERPIYIARAPGRLDVMGGIADYSGARVLELPLAHSTMALAQPHESPRLDVVSRTGSGWRSFAIDLDWLRSDGALGRPAALAAWFRERGREHDRWASYVVGVAQWCVQRADSSAPSGLRMMITSAVPEGRGIASSAALEVACGAAISAAFGVRVTGVELATACQAVENHVVGAPCGIMDQMTSACGKRDRLLELRCQPGSIEGYVEVPAEFRFFGIDSGVSHAVTGAEYGTVRTAAFMGYRMIADAAGFAVTLEGGHVWIDDPRWAGYLANLTPAEFAEYGRALPDEMAGAEFVQRYGGTTDAITEVLPDRRYPVRRATEHPIREQQRVDRFAELLAELPQRAHAAVELGELMAQSHASYGACGLGSEGTDRLVELIHAAGPARGLFGAKITGGGSGGTVAVFGAADAEERVHEVAARYAAESERQATVFGSSGPGARETGVLVVEPGRRAVG